MRKGQDTDQLDAFALFPDLMQNLAGADQEKKGENCVLPPSPPDLSWLSKEGYEEQERVEDIPTALILMGNGHEKDSFSSDLQELGYRIESADTPAEAVNKLKFSDFAAILMHVGFGSESLAESAVHNYLTWLPTAKRRTLFYILVGPDFRTLYGLEALSLSVNLVINDADAEQLKAILRKSFRDYEELFGPLVEALDGYGEK